MAGRVLTDGRGAQPVRLCVMGYGGSVRRLFEILADRREPLAATSGVRFVVHAVATAHHGTLLASDGVDVTDVLAMTSEPDWRFPDASMPVEDLLAACGSTVLVEATPLQPGGATATRHVRAALTSGVDAITVNKGPVAWSYRELAALATSRNRQFRFEGAVMDGCPVFSLVERTLPGTTVSGFSGVLNSTSNVVLERMSAGGSLADGVRHAQEHGFAEADPRQDLSGYDTAVKVAALANVWLDAGLDPDEIVRVGVSDDTAERAREAMTRGQRLRLLGSAARHDDHVDASVDLVEVGTSSPFFATTDASSTLQIFTDLAGVIEVTERSPGLTQTAYALLADLLHCAERQT
jgi:homoserine dehydrogenase